MDIPNSVKGVREHAVGGKRDGVHRKVAAAKVAYEVGNKCDRLRSAVVTVAAVGAEGGDLDRAVTDLYGDGAVLYAGGL